MRNTIPLVASLLVVWAASAVAIDKPKTEPVEGHSSSPREAKAIVKAATQRRAGFRCTTQTHNPATLKIQIGDNEKIP